MRIDSHQHFWNYDAGEYPWIQREWPIRRSFLPDDLQTELKACELDGCVAVQARQSLEESRWLLELANKFPFIKGVVGWVDLRSTEVKFHLEEFAAQPKFVGVRHVVQDERDDDFMLGDDFQRGISCLRQHSLKYDLLIFPRQLPAAIKLVSAFPEQAFVLDHIAKPDIKSGAIDSWRKEIEKLAALPNVCCKISGLITEADWQGWKPKEFTPYLDAIFDAFGMDRVMFGSDWPVALLAGTYRQVFELARDYMKQFGPDAEAKVFGGNAVKFYDLKP